MSRAEARILEAQDDKRLAESQLAQAQQDLARMREEASVSDDPPPEHLPRCDPNEEVQRLRVQVAKLEAEIARHRPPRGLDGVSKLVSEMQRVRAEITALRGGQTVAHPTDVQTVSGANLVNRSKRAFLDTLPPLGCLNKSILGSKTNNFQPLTTLVLLLCSIPLVISNRAVLMAERYAPLRNAGGTFITQARCLKISRTLIKS